jgi:hypothetical protein
MSSFIWQGEGRPNVAQLHTSHRKSVERNTHSSDMAPHPLPRARQLKYSIGTLRATQREESERKVRKLNILALLAVYSSFCTLFPNQLLSYAGSVHHKVEDEKFPFRIKIEFVSIWKMKY